MTTTPNGVPIILCAECHRGELQARLDAVVALARKWATQPTDWDEDTEQQIEDGTELLTLLGLTLEEQP